MQNYEKSHFPQDSTSFWVSTSIKELHLKASRPLIMHVFFWGFQFNLSRDRLKMWCDVILPGIKVKGEITELLVKLLAYSDK